MILRLLVITLLALSLKASVTFDEANLLYARDEYKKAFEAFSLLAKDDADAAYMLAKMYEQGEGCEKSEEKAQEWYKASAHIYYEQAKHSPLRNVQKHQKEIFKTLDRVDNNQTQETLRQFVQSLYNFKAHNANYFLPFSYRYDDNYDEVNGHEAGKVETEFQVSLKYDFAANFFKLREIYSVAYTQKSFWQSYKESAFIRESNYSPEFFVTFPTSSQDDGGFLKGIRVGVAHQSNGRGAEYERSWNYVNASLFFQYDILLCELKLWARLPDATDYNPELIDTIGHGYFRIAVPYKKHLFDMKIMNNFNSKGSIEFNYTHPVSSRDDLFFYMKFFNGYGESLIDYDNHIKKVGIGFSISR
ncbi:Phospholipase A1 [Sulfurimonas denitrificans DSM 1251]|uniref:Phosphatidylcholine 1-acylhydrolase n=1 Tax=Sulfurimonas denitrificans (strain ATCC 33889 / DSM 1251) TaxID=326298 RepID=Q30UN4_SULDN|nr:phospholipase A [Sulfurimonas denitrificans]ABB43297.1 Phospholipase A1 [Sulfurimonas denitrificans DSM 1251]MDD3443333.1 phospholipase A [Sulfurimonas denitrificans]